MEAFRMWLTKVPTANFSLSSICTLSIYISTLIKLFFFSNLKLFYWIERLGGVFKTQHQVRVCVYNILAN